MESGVVLYSIESDDCLNGVYTNDGLDGEIFNEIARKLLEHNDDPICGVYECLYFDRGKGYEIDKHQVNLNIDLTGDTLRTYSFSWRKNGTDLFKGIGYKMNERQIVVHYTSV